MKASTAIVLIIAAGVAASLAALATKRRDMPAEKARTKRNQEIRDAMMGEIRVTSRQKLAGLDWDASDYAKHRERFKQAPRNESKKKRAA